MSLITMCCHDTAENGRTEYTEKTLASLMDTVDFTKHRLIIIDNDSCYETKSLLEKIVFLKTPAVQVITLPENLGTSRGLNRAWIHRKPKEYVVKLDNDVIIHSSRWIEEMEEAIERAAKLERPIGILGLKRKDLIQTTWHPDANYRSEYIMLPHEPGQRWICLERSDDIIGTCTMFNHLLLDKVGFSFQPSRYGFEDVLLSHRSHLAGFMNGFLSHIEIDHIDTGQNEYIHWKQKESGDKVNEMIAVFKSYVSGERPIYEPFY